MTSVLTLASSGLQGRIRDDDTIQGPVQTAQASTVLPLLHAEAAPTAPAFRMRQTPALDQFLGHDRGHPDGSIAPPLPALSAPPGPLADAPAAGEWLREERRRLEAYMQMHFSLLQQQCEQFAAWRAQAEAALNAREQELNRRQAEVPSCSAVPVGNAAALVQQVHVAATEQEMQRFALIAAEQRNVVAQLRDEAQRLRDRCRHAREDLDRLEAITRQKKQIKDDMERRQQALERSEQSLQQRLAETAELELRIRNELDWQQTELAREGRELEQRRHKAMQDSREIDMLRRKLCEVSHEMRQRRRLTLTS